LNLSLKVDEYLFEMIFKEILPLLELYRDFMCEILRADVIDWKVSRNNRSNVLLKRKLDDFLK